MTWDLERKRDAAIHGPLARGYLHEDTRIIERPGWFQLVTPSAFGYLNEVAFSQVEPEDADRVIDEVVATYRAHHQPTKWWVGPWTKPADFAQRLESRGFLNWDVRGMGIETGAAIPVPRDVVVVEVDASTVEDYVRAAMLGWSTPDDQLAAVRRGYAASLSESPRTMVYFGAKKDGEWLGTASLQLRGDYGYLLLSQVLERARGQGVYKALVAARLAFLRARGIAYATTQAREATSAPILDHLGFETLFTASCWLLMP